MKAYLMVGISCMKNAQINKLIKFMVTGNKVIIVASIVLTYLLISLYFTNHFFYNTVINGVNVSLKSYDDANSLIKENIKEYKLIIIERNGETEEITGQQIAMQFNEEKSISEIYSLQKSLNWIRALFSEQKYYVDNLYIYNKEYLKNEIKDLRCLNIDIIEPENVNFKYTNDSYEVIKEEYGNKINKVKLNDAIKMSIVNGKTKLDLDKKNCYVKPQYTINSDKALSTLNLLNKYVSTMITYKFGSKNEVLNGDIINKWLNVDENLEVSINKMDVMNYVNELSRKYDTVGIERNFKTSVGKTVVVKGGLYGWKINQNAETKAILENIILGKVIEKEPIYTQKALSRNENEIGDTYVEINITRQYLWFYKDGELISQGPVVTGNPNRGNSTVVGAYMLNYKQKGVTLIGPGYEAKVTYWMPFYGNIGIHDASWRYSFGGEIYKQNGSHGCVNSPLYLAKAIFENIDEGIPIICYEE